MICRAASLRASNIPDGLCVRRRQRSSLACRAKAATANRVKSDYTYTTAQNVLYARGDNPSHTHTTRPRSFALSTLGCDSRNQPSLDRRLQQARGCIPTRRTGRGSSSPRALSKARARGSHPADVTRGVRTVTSWHGGHVLVRGDARAGKVYRAR